jgi:hypothetical protein
MDLTLKFPLTLLRAQDFFSVEGSAGDGWTASIWVSDK